MQQKRVLIVDDDIATVEILSEELSIDGDFIVDRATKGKVAEELLQKHKYDVVITDYKMPNMSGVELGQLIRSQSPSTQIILMTAYDVRSIRNDPDMVTFDEYLVKPFPIRKVREIVMSAVAKIRSNGHTGQLMPGHDELQEPLATLQMDTNAHCVLLLRTEGYLLGKAGTNTSLDVSAVSALIAANYMAAVELARLLGNESKFKSSYHEGPDYDIYALAVDSDHLLAIIFGAKSKAGMVRYYAQKTASRLHKIIDGIAPQSLGENDLATEAVDEALDLLFAETPVRSPKRGGKTT
ncbi:MAG: response regulator [Anaerolineales bacterium]|nr:response regulator [Anaerolineales bacterium]MCB0029065.1 response regulator [Anaerolineales bacterium]MCB8961952.1 response regulator [Ardenticatenales bacterium]